MNVTESTTDAVLPQNETRTKKNLTTVPSQIKRVSSTFHWQNTYLHQQHFSPEKHQNTPIDKHWMALPDYTFHFREIWPQAKSIFKQEGFNIRIVYKSNTLRKALRTKRPQNTCKLTNCIISGLPRCKNLWSSRVT